MDDVECQVSPPLADSLPFQLSVLGTVVTDQLAERLREYGMKPRHVALMNLLGATAPTSQQELARIMGVAPSLIVSLADHLAEHDVVRRERDPADRRRQVLTLSERGQELLTACARASAALDGELVADLTAEEQTALRAALHRVAARAGARPGG